MEEAEKPWSDWVISSKHLTASRLKKFYRNHPDETESMLTNLDQQLLVLNNNRARSFPNMETTHCHREGRGLYAMSQSGGKGTKESRLYFYPDNQAGILWILDVGTKESQTKDVTRLQDYIRKQWKKEKRDV